MLSLAGFTPSDRVLGIEGITDEGGEPSLTWFAFRCSMKPCRGSQIGSIAARPVSPGLGLAGGHQTIPLLLPSFKSTTAKGHAFPRASLASFVPASRNTDPYSPRSPLQADVAP